MLAVAETVAASSENCYLQHDGANIFLDGFLEKFVKISGQKIFFPALTCCQCKITTSWINMNMNTEHNR